MPSTTTYLSATNSVLRAVNQPPVSSTVFTTPEGESGAREIRAVKEILAECYSEYQNDRPDSFWERSTEIYLYAPYTTGGIYRIGTGAPIDGKIHLGLGTAWQDVPWFSSGADPDTRKDTMLHVAGERQYFRVNTLTAAHAQLNTFQPNIEHIGYNDATAPLPYTLFKYLYSLPTDFRDVLNVYNPYVGMDLRPMGAERMVELISSHGYLITTAGGPSGWGSDPEFYGIWRDSTGVPMLVVDPIVTQDRILTLRYHKMRGTLSEATDLFDLDEDALPILLNLAKSRAAIEILRDTELAAYYGTMGSQAKELAETKSMEAGAEFQRIHPATGEDYRNFYGRSGKLAAERRIILRRS